MTEGRLTKEHIIAKAIGGTVTLARSSCRNCSDITREIERRCFALTLKGFRIKAGFKTKDAIAPRIHVKHENGLSKFLPLNSYDPALLVMPVYPLPSLLTGMKPATTVDIWGVCLNPRLPDDLPTGVKVGGTPFNDRDFARLLAKIAHAYSVAERGINGFHPLLREFIRGVSNTPSTQFVGCVDPEAAGNPNHYIMDYSSQHDPPFLVTRIRLFGLYGAPTYLVVTGTLDRIS